MQGIEPSVANADAEDDGASAEEVFAALKASVERSERRLAKDISDLRAAMARELAGPFTVTIPDYAPTFRGMMDLLEKIEAKPAPKVDAETVEAVLKGPMASVAASMREANRAAKQLETVGDQFKGRVELSNERYVWGGCGLLLGVVLWVMLSGPIARGLPESWAMPERMAAATLATDRWDAGSRLMRSLDPVSWERMVHGADLMNSPVSGGVLQACLAKTKIGEKTREILAHYNRSK